MPPFNDIDVRHRRTSDHNLEAIEEKIISLIEATEDSKDKAFLLILMKINDSITTNTGNTNKIAKKLEEISTSVDTHKALLERGKGWKDVIVWGLGLLQALGIWSLITFNEDLNTLHREQSAQKIELIKHISAEFGSQQPQKVQ